MTVDNHIKKYFSCKLTSGGFCCAYNTIYKREPDSRVYILNDGDDLERAVFFDRLIKNLSGYSLTAFNPFYDDGADGIYIENLNTYILSDGGYNRIAPVIPGVWEKFISISGDKSYSPPLKEEIILRRTKENGHYKKACEALKRASFIREKLHSEVSTHLNDDKAINFMRRFCARTFRDKIQSGTGVIRLLSSATPLGIHTHYDTIFSMCEKTVDIHDEAGFAAAIIAGVIKDYAANEKIPFIMSPAYFSGVIPQFLIFPATGTAVTVSDGNHILPFEPAEKISASRFINGDAVSWEKIKILIDVENRLLEKCVTEIYAGREERFAASAAIGDYSDTQKAEESADKFADLLIN